MSKYIKLHEQYILNQYNDANITKDLLKYHQLQIKHLKHERLVHLIIMVFVGTICLLSFFYLLYSSSLPLVILTTILFVLEVFYIMHYYLLENTIQGWYKIENTFIQHLYGVGTNTYKG